MYLHERWRLVVAQGDLEAEVVVKEVSNHYGH